MAEKRRIAKDESPKGKNTPEIKAIEKDLDAYVALENLSESTGGKILVDNFAKDIIALCDSIGAHYKTASHAGLLGLCADLDNKMAILRLITRAKKNKHLAEEALKEELLRQEEADEG